MFKISKKFRKMAEDHIRDSLKAADANDQARLAELNIREQEMAAEFSVEQTYAYNLIMLSNVVDGTLSKMDKDIAERCGSDDPADKNKFLEEQILLPMQEANQQMMDNADKHIESIDANLVRLDENLEQIRKISQEAEKAAEAVKSPHYCKGPTGLQ